MAPTPYTTGGKLPWNRVPEVRLPHRKLSIAVAVATLALSACATPARMYDEATLNQVATGCGLALGELIQDDSEKKLLLLIHENPTVKQRVCVAKWARRNGLKAVFVNMNVPS